MRISRAAALPDATTWNTNATWRFNVESADVGVYEITAHVKSSNAAVSESSRTTLFEYHTGNVASLDALTADQTSPQAPGTTVTFSAQASGGDAPLQYEFHRRSLPDGAPVRANTWNTNHSWSFTPEFAGAYEITAKVKSSNATAAESSRTIVFEWGTVTPATVDSLTSDLSAPRPFGETVAWTASASGDTTPLEYRFQPRESGSTTWSEGRTWSSDPSWLWTAPSEGAWEIAVSVRSAGSTTIDDELIAPFVITAPASITAFTSDVASPQQVGAAITWTLYTYVKSNPVAVADPIGLAGVNYYGKPNKQIQVDCKSATALGCTYFDYDLPECGCSPGCDLATKKPIWTAQPKFSAQVRVYYSTDCYDPGKIILEEQKHVNQWQKSLSEINAATSALKSKKFASVDACRSACFSWESTVYKHLINAQNMNNLIEYTHPWKNCDGSVNWPG